MVVDREIEMRGRKIPVGLDRAAQFSDRFFILGKKDFHRPVEAAPKIDSRIARAQPQRILGTGCGLRRAVGRTRRATTKPFSMSPSQTRGAQGREIR
jgi:hypothetical protein